MNEPSYLYLVAMEQCNEVAQRLSKASRFTVDEVQPGQDMTNGIRVLQELADLITVVEMLQDLGHLPNYPLGARSDWKKAKREKVKKFMEYSRERGTLL
jgi:hypothetical protein